MTSLLRRAWPFIFLLTFLLGIIGLTLRPYGWNITAMLHIDHVIADAHPLPRGFIVLDVPSYDGAQYYQIARNIPAIFNPSTWPALRSSPPGSYAYQRFLLPLAARLVSFGQDGALPTAFIGVNILALLGTLLVILRWKPTGGLYALALTLSPTAAVAMHFTLAEPLTLLLITTVLIRLRERTRLKWLDVLLLSLAVWSREVIILLVGFLMAYTVLRRQWRDLMLLVIPAASFLLLHGFIYAIFGQIPFLISTEAHQIPGSAALKVIAGLRGYDRYTLSAAALALCFVLPGVVWNAAQIVRDQSLKFLPLGATMFLLVMLTLSDNMWGSITSVGRVITPAYAFTLLAYAERDTWLARVLALACLALGVATSVGLALMVHPFTIAH